MRVRDARVPRHDEREPATDGERDAHAGEEVEGGVPLGEQDGRDEGDEHRQTDADRAKAVRILQTDLPVIPIAWYQQTLAAASDLRGVTVDPFERSFGLQDLQRSE